MIPASRGRAITGIELSLSVGVASVIAPAKNFSAAELLTRAGRCLYAAQTAGGNCVKSIEL